MKTPEEFFNDNQALVFFITKKWFRSFPQSDYDDLVAEARIALWRASKMFDQTKGAQFSTFASKVMSNRMGELYRKLKRQLPTESLQETVFESKYGPITLENVLESEITIESEIKQKKLYQEVMKTKYLKLSFLEELTQQQIGKILGCSQGHAGRMLKKERSKLLKII